MASSQFRPHTPYLYLAVPLILLAVFFVMPVFFAIQMSGMDYSHDLYTPEFVGLENYQRLAASPEFWNSLWVTLLFVVGVVPAMCTLPMALAVLVNGNLKGISVFRTLLYIPVIISMVVVGIAWKWLYAYDGLINYLLTTIGLPKVGWLVNPDVALYAVMVVIVWKGLAYYMMMYLAHLQSIPKELYEAAEIDGASTWQQHWNVTLPALWPTLVMVAIISTIGSLKIFTEIYVMTQGGPMGSTQTLVYYLYQRAFENLDLGVACAAGLVLMGILLVLSIVQMRFSDWESLPSGKKPTVKGAVKA
jgi:putative chitobiose transport system permease protein